MKKKEFMRMILGVFIFVLICFFYWKDMLSALSYIQNKRINKLWLSASLMLLIVHCVINAMRLQYFLDQKNKKKILSTLFHSEFLSWTLQQVTPSAAFGELLKMKVLCKYYDAKFLGLSLIKDRCILHLSGVAYLSFCLSQMNFQEVISFSFGRWIVENFGDFYIFSFISTISIVCLLYKTNFKYFLNTLLSQLMPGIVFFCTARSYQSEINFLECISLYAFVSVGTIIPSIGSWGVREGVVVFIFSIFRPLLTKDEAIAISISFGFYQWLAICVYFIVRFIMKFSEKRLGFVCIAFYPWLI